MLIPTVWCLTYHIGQRATNGVRALPSRVPPYLDHGLRDLRERADTRLVFETIWTHAQSEPRQQRTHLLAVNKSRAAAPHGDNSIL